MKRLGAVLVFLMLLVFACGNTDTTQTSLASRTETNAQAQDSEPTTTEQTGPNIDIEATITFRVQATVRALLSATPITSPTREPRNQLTTPSRLAARSILHQSQPGLPPAPLHRDRLYRQLGRQIAWLRPMA